MVIMGKRYTINKDNGRWRRRVLHIIPELIGERAFENSLVQGFWDYMIHRYRPQYDIALITPCSNVKPYPLSPMNLKIKGILRRLGLWDYKGKKPLIEWLFLSDLLGFVPYTYSWIPPACCYDVPPDIVETKKTLYRKIKHILEEAWVRISPFYNKIIIYLPQKYYKFLPRRLDASKTVFVKYHIFRTKILEESLVREIFH